MQCMCMMVYVSFHTEIAVLEFVYDFFTTYTYFVIT